VVAIPKLGKNANSIDTNNADKEESFCGWARKSSEANAIPPADVLSRALRIHRRVISRSGETEAPELLRRARD